MTSSNTSLVGKRQSAPKRQETNNNQKQVKASIIIFTYVNLVREWICSLYSVQFIPMLLSEAAFIYVTRARDASKE